MVVEEKKLPARFFKADSGNEPVRDWLFGLSRADKKIIGEDIKTVELGWPVGMPLCRSITSRRGLWEVRSSLPGRRIARVLFFTHEGYMVLLHGIVKKTQKTPDADLDLAEKRMKQTQAWPQKKRRKGN